MATGRRQAIEREARRLFDMLQQGRRATITTADSLFRADVLARLRQLMVGEDIAGRWEDPDD